MTSLHDAATLLHHQLQVTDSRLTPGQEQHGLHVADEDFPGRLFTLDPADSEGDFKVQVLGSVTRVLVGGDADCVF